MRLEVKFGSQALCVDLPDDPPPTLLHLKDALYALTAVAPAAQKLLGRPNLNTSANDPRPLSELGIRAGTRLMLIGSAAADIAQTISVTDVAARQQSEVREQMLRRLPRPFWLLPPFAGLLADPFMDGCGSPLEHGSAVLSLLALEAAIDAALSRQPREDSRCPALLRNLSPEERAAIVRAQAVLRSGFHFAFEAAQALKPQAVIEIVRRATARIDALAIGEWALHPSGWDGLGTHGVIYILIQRSGVETFTVVVVNRGGIESLAYHPSWPTAEKILSCPYLRFEHVSSARLLDKSFWLLLLSLWVRGNDPAARSEFARAEVFYDALLPWLVEKGPNPTDPLRFASEMSLGALHQDPTSQTEAPAQCFAADIHAHGASMARSASSAIKGATAAFLYLIEQFGVTARETQKAVKYAIKYEFLLRAAVDLSLQARSFLPLNYDPSNISSDVNGECGPILRALPELLCASGAEHSDGLLQITDVFRATRASGVVFTTGRRVVLEDTAIARMPVLIYLASLAGQLAADFAAAAPVLAARGAALLFVSSDKDPSAYAQHSVMLPDYVARASFPCDALVRAIDLTGAAAGAEILIFGTDGRLRHRGGAAALRCDPTADLFPFGREWRGISLMSATDVAMLRSASAVFAHHTLHRAQTGALEERDVKHVLGLLQAMQSIVKAIPHESYTDAVGKEKDQQQMANDSHLCARDREAGCVLPLLTSDDLRLPGAVRGFHNAGLLPQTGTAAFYGTPFSTQPPRLDDVGDLRRAGSLAALIHIMRRAVDSVEALWARARHSGTASRVAVQMHMIEYISWLFTAIVPIPAPRDDSVPPEERDVTARFYNEDPFPSPGEDGRDTQAVLQECIYKLTLSYATAWQTVECPTRAYDAERCLVAMAMLVVYDAVARHTANSQQCSALAALLSAGEGYFLSTRLGRQARSFADVSARLELVRPRFLLVRSSIIRYITAQEQHCSRELFDFRMPEKLEVRKSSVTVEFLRRLLDACGYRLSDAGGMAGPSEMDQLMQWLCSDRTPLAQARPEFGRLRDMVLLTKFLATMEMRDAQLLSRRKQLDTFATWRLTFDEETPGRQMSAGWRTRPQPLQWECLLVRGRDADIADIVAKGLGDRELNYCEGLVLCSPIDVAARLGLSARPTEDDVLHAPALPSFGGAMPAEESEVLLACLTAPYVRVPLVLDFFASQDRHAYLFAPELQAVLRAVLFEPAEYVPPQAELLDDKNEEKEEEQKEEEGEEKENEKEKGGDGTKPIVYVPRIVPMRLSESQRLEIVMRRLHGDLTRRDDEALLGTSYGLLRNELHHSPEAVLEPLSRLLRSLVDLGRASVYSANASYVLFLVGVVCDVLQFCAATREESSRHAVLKTFAMSMMTALLTTVRPILREWCDEAEANDDTPTQCVAHSYLAIIHHTARQTGFYENSAVHNEHNTRYSGVPNPSTSSHRGHRDHFTEGEREETENTTEGDRHTNEETHVDASGWHLSSFLESCAFVRSRHSFGMGMQRSQLAARADDAQLAPEERLIRFLQAQGLDTANISRAKLEEGRQLMLCGGRRRAVFVQIRSRHYSDTVRVPNLVRSDVGSTTESRELRLPPADVPENVLFAALLEDNRGLLHALDAMPSAEVSAQLQRIVHVVLRDHHRDEAQRLIERPNVDNRNFQSQHSGLIIRNNNNNSNNTSANTNDNNNNNNNSNSAGVDDVELMDSANMWNRTSIGVYSGPRGNGILFHAQTCELFWRNDELKPVPDSMSHFTDFETVLGRGVLQCGLVSRHEHRHWVKVVGTPFDLVEWDAPDATAQGAQSPLATRGELPTEAALEVAYGSCIYDRPVDIFSDAVWPVKRERWAIALLRAAMRGLFPSGELSYSPLAPRSTSQENAADTFSAPTHIASSNDTNDKVNEEDVMEMRFVMNDAPQYPDKPERATWKEIVARLLPVPHLVAFNLVSHGRRMFRAVVYATNQQYCLHSLAPITRPRILSELRALAFEAGEFKRRVQSEGSLEIYRYNRQLRGRELYIPARLLQGIMPGALLEAFLFWQGEDNTLRGYAMEEEDYWFGYALEVRLRPECGDCVITRRPLKKNRTTPQCSGEKATQECAGHRKDSNENDDEVEKEEVEKEEEEEEEEKRALAAILRSALRSLSLRTCRWILHRCAGDITAAIAFAADAANRDEIIRYESEETPRVETQHTEKIKKLDGGNEEEEEEGKGENSHQRETAREEELVLVNLLAHASTMPLLRLLVRVEDSSHILVWAHSGTGPNSLFPHACPVSHSTDDALCVDIAMIELPRLRARFYPSVDLATGARRLHLADHPGWFLAEQPDALAEQCSALAKLQAPFQQFLLLANAANDFALLVPNHDFTPMHVVGDPFSPMLLFDRASLSWQENVASPFYLYVVHPCVSFLIPPSLAASLYYAALQCATRDYAAAMRTLESCHTDSSFSREEEFMFGRMARTLADRSPDAHAVRLKLAHAVQYSPHEVPWPIHVELDAYFAKKRHVSHACQLSREELSDLMCGCSRAHPLVRVQIHLWNAFSRTERRNDIFVCHNPDGFLSIGAETPTLLRCGEPWERLLRFAWDRVGPQRPNRVTYEAPAPEALQDAGLVEFLWKDSLLADEESGANSHLGFYFLYALATGALSAELCGESCGATLAALLARWFHLRHSRWGREESADQTTADALPSWAAAVIQLVTLTAHKGTHWPRVVDDARALYRMRSGVDISALDVGLSDDGTGALAIRGRGAMNRSGMMGYVDGGFGTVRETPVALRNFFLALDRTAREVYTRDAAVREVRDARMESRCRIATQRWILVRMWNHLKPRKNPSNCAMSSLHVRILDMARVCAPCNAEFDTEMDFHALLYFPLGGLFSVASSIMQYDTIAPDSAVSAELPFSLESHAQCTAPLARRLLARLEEDTARFAQQSQSQTRRGLSALSYHRVDTLLRGDCAAEVADALAAASLELQQCITALTQMADGDAARVSRLTQIACAMANEINNPPGPLTDHARLAHIANHRGDIPLEWLLSALLSSEMDRDVCAVNPFHGDVSKLRAAIIALMLVASRAHMARHARQAVRQVALFLEMCALLRKIPHVSGGPERLQELLQRFSVAVDVDIVTKAAMPDGAAVQLPHDVAAGLESRLWQLADEAVEVLSARRHYTVPGDHAAQTTSAPPSSSEVLASAQNAAHVNETDTVSMDPRYVLFEFIHCILLRPRQVEMVRWFVDNARRGESRVQQMIMGQGKTTVVGPLLALILADGEQLVTQVMPTALLEQTRGILRRCFSVVVPKHIYTLQFDRGCDDSDTSGVERLRKKLTAAARNRSILISAPECIKSVFLKAIEQMHMLETTETSDLDAAYNTVDNRLAAQAQTLLHRTKQRSAMADAITPILELWQRGVLIMDEVDVLLHPLRSELNFPIGLKHPIDLSGPRWELPIHLLNAVFYFQCGRTAAVDGAPIDEVEEEEDDGRHVSCNDNENMSPCTDSSTEGGRGHRPRDMHTRTAELLQAVRDVIAEGYITRVLQREPHLVLLDMAFYQQKLLPVLLPWTQLWLYDHLYETVTVTGTNTSTSAEREGLWSFLVERTTMFLQRPERPEADSSEAIRIRETFAPLMIQKLNLAHDWLHCLLPHCLAKIDRVSFGLLQPREITLAGEAAERMPLSRRLMAIPFVAKDVPSRSSEFAHPDVVIGLTVLAFRYEGMRYADMRELLLQLKQDFARQTGPKEHRPAARLYHHWISLSNKKNHSQMTMNKNNSDMRGHLHLWEQTRHAAHSHSYAHHHGRDGADLSNPLPTVDFSGVPLSLLQVTDEVALRALHRQLRYVPEVAHYYLCSHVFPRTMNFQDMKISACGHELGSSMLFSKRIGFSGTPSNLLPLDLGECFYEPGSDGRVLSVLTNPSVTSTEELPVDWTPLRLLDRIAAARSPPFHALIDAGALITNMENEEVARYLLAQLPPSLFDGVVFLDTSDRQVILQRSNGLTVPVAQSGVALTRRFTFFDQVHTTGTDVKQAASVTAVVTLGKDLVFRDYAQGAYRMRGVGKGQRLRLYLIPEVLQRIHATLGSLQTGNLLRDVPAWLLLNSIQMEGLQFVKLTTQEMENVWRKKALRHLLADSTHANTHTELYGDMLRCRRFHIQRPPPAVHSVTVSDTDLPSVFLLRASIREFREHIAFPVESTVGRPATMLGRLASHMDAKPQELLAGDTASQDLLRELMNRLRSSLYTRDESHTSAQPRESAMLLDSEVVHEQEAEQEQEQEAEQEEQRVTVCSRDDERHVPWDVGTLHTHCADVRATDSCFYVFRSLRVHPKQPPLLVNDEWQISDNFHRAAWHGAGERRLKNAFLFIEWLPTQSTQAGIVHAGLVTLAEGESLRWMMHQSKARAVRAALKDVRMALRVVSSGGRYMDATESFADAVPYCREWYTQCGIRNTETGTNPTCLSVERDGAALLYRFFNNDMFYSTKELALLEMILRGVPHLDRMRFFTDCLRARRRNRNRWDDTPVAALFAPPSERASIRPLAMFSALRDRLEDLVAATSMPLRQTLTVELQGFHERLTREYTLEHAGEHGSHASKPSLPVSSAARIIHEAFPSKLKTFSPQDVELALRCIVSREGESVDETRIYISSLFEAFPALSNEVLQGRLMEARGAAASAEEMWNCTMCTLLNDPALRRCVMCDTPRPSGTYQTSTENNMEEAVMDSHWSCPQCTFSNESRRQEMCSVCLTPNPSRVEGRTQSGGEGNFIAWNCPPGCWVCSVEHGGCSKFNPNELFYCQVCDKAKPDLASLRF